MLTLTPDVILALPVDERGLAVLRDLVDVDEWNEYNYLLRYKQTPGAARAVAESLAWLRGRAFIARTPGQTTDAAIFVTPVGAGLSLRDSRPCGRSSTWRPGFTRRLISASDASSFSANTSRQFSLP